MKIIYALLSSTLLLASSLSAVEPAKSLCPCTNCACTKESNCGCVVEKESKVRTQACKCGDTCPCMPSCDCK